ncbi:hypothetical protein CTAYLR_007035 [Chrysophaeum taylorii]|uniref:Proteasome alpha-type subunits domain-containing protein n=1 Tax=Chrysophaeum taylorii TaxID=2483200 RepID=A0AAD7U6W7_9STRA|nr:hypothetical protein CTAYLR_007035 [Chrysophaeum taylorii]
MHGYDGLRQQRSRANERRNVAYDREPCVFDPRGRVLQLDYAEVAANQGETAIGAVTEEVAVLCAQSSLRDKLCVVDGRCAATYAGLRADGRGLVDLARLRAARERLSSPDLPPTPRALARALADATHECARGGGKRAYGARLVLAGFHDDRPELWSVGPGGDARQHREIVAVGKDAHRVDLDAWDSAVDVRAAVARVVALAMAARDDDDDDKAAVLQVLVLKERRDDTEHRAGLLGWRADVLPGDLVGDRLAEPLEASLMGALDPQAPHHEAAPRSYEAFYGV